MRGGEHKGRVCSLQWLVERRSGLSLDPPAQQSPSRQFTGGNRWAPQKRSTNTLAPGSALRCLSPRWTVAPRLSILMIFVLFGHWLAEPIVRRPAGGTHCRGGCARTWQRALSRWAGSALASTSQPTYWWSCRAASWRW